MTNAQQAERAEALDRLREWLRPGDTVFTILRHVSRSGMQRTIDVVVMLEGAPFTCGWAVAKALGLPFDRDRGGVKVGGCGMDMGFHLVYELSARLFPDGFGCVGEGCPSSDHSNGARSQCKTCNGNGYLDEGHAEECTACAGRGDVRTSYPRGAGVMHRDGGYALRARWL